MILSKSTRRLAAAGVIVGSVVAGGTASAVLDSFKATGQVTRTTRTQHDYAQTSSTDYVTVPVASIGVNTGDQSKMVEARFTAASGCIGQPSSWCTVRIVARNTSTGAITEMSPDTGPYARFVFDSAGDDYPEAHAMARTAELLGSYRIEVQFAVTNGATTFYLYDWNFTVDVMNPA